MDGDKLDFATPRVGWVLLAGALVIGGAAALAYGAGKKRTLQSAQHLLEAAENSLVNLEERISARDRRRIAV